jgi:hypothetical protein
MISGPMGSLNGEVVDHRMREGGAPRRHSNAAEVMLDCFVVKRVRC